MQSLRDRAHHVLLRLLAGGPALALYESARDRLDAIEPRSRISGMVADEIDRLVASDPDFVERAKGRLIGRMVAAQENLECVVIATINLIEEVPGVNEVIDAAEPSEDWLNVFSREAETVSSAPMRNRLAKLMALELQRPRSFGKTAIRFAAEVEEESLAEFSVALHHRLGDTIIRDPQTWSHGEWLDRGRLLEAEGLIMGHEGFANRTVVLDGNGNGFFLGDTLGLVAQGAPGSVRPISVWSLTRLGTQIAALLPPADELASATRLARLISKEDLKKLSAGPWVSAGGGRYTVSPSIELWVAGAST